MYDFSHYAPTWSDQQSVRHLRALNDSTHNTVIMLSCIWDLTDHWVIGCVAGLELADRL